MAKKISGERSLKVGGKTYTLRLGFDETSEIEDRYGSFPKLMQEIATYEPRLSMLAFVLSQMIKVEPTKAFAIMMEDRDKVFGVIVEAILATLNPENEKGSNSGE